MMEDCLSVDGGAVAGAESAKLKTAHCKLYIVLYIYCMLRRKSKTCCSPWVVEIYQLAPNRYKTIINLINFINVTEFRAV